MKKLQNDELQLIIAIISSKNYCKLICSYPCPPCGGASRRFFLFRLAGGASRQFFFSRLRRGLTAILFIPPFSGAYRQFFLTRLTAVPHGDSFSSASQRLLSAIPFIPLLFKRALIIYWHGFVLFEILRE